MFSRQTRSLGVETAPRESYSKTKRPSSMNTVRSWRPSGPLRAACASSRNLATTLVYLARRCGESILSSPGRLSYRSLPFLPSAVLTLHARVAPRRHRAPMRHTRMHSKVSPWIPGHALNRVPAYHGEQAQEDAGARFSLASKPSAMFLLLNDSVKCGINPTHQRAARCGTGRAPRSEWIRGFRTLSGGHASTKPSEQTRRATSTHTREFCRRCRTRGFLTPANAPAASR